MKFSSAIAAAAVWLCMAATTIADSQLTEFYRQTANAYDDAARDVLRASDRLGELASEYRVRACLRNFTIGDARPHSVFQ